MRRWLCSLIFAGCQGTIGPGPTTVYVTGAPFFEPIGPGVEAAVDSEEPLFRVDGAEYLYRDEVWLESTSDRYGFHYIDHLPGALVEPRARTHVHVRRTL